MANEEHLAILRQGVEVWNQWREEHRKIQPFLRMGNFDKAFYTFLPDLSYADLSSADLNNADFSETKLVATCLQSACLQGANFTRADLRSAKLRKANLRQAHLVLANLKRADLIGAEVSDANLNGVDLHCANLSFANLSRTNLVKANLSKADFRNSDCSNVNFSTSYALHADFTGAKLTGACIAEWHISSSTKLERVTCDYIYRNVDENGQFSSRRPIDNSKQFTPGEFTQRFQVFTNALETIDLNFPRGIDWQAFFRSFQTLQSQNPNADISIQGMERKAEGFIVRLEVNQEADKATIETQAKQLYAQKLQELEAQYEEKLQLQGAHLEDIREHLSFERQDKTRLFKVVETMAKAPKYDLRNAQFSGGFAEVVKGNQYGSTINNYSQKTKDIVRLLTSLRDLAQEFPEPQREEAQVHLEDLAADLAQPEECHPAKLKTRIAGLLGVLVMLGGGVATATDFANNVLELSEKLDISAETFQPQLEQLNPDF